MTMLHAGELPVKHENGSLSHLKAGWVSPKTQIQRVGKICNKKGNIISPFA
jgi:hypothetical protein